MAAYQAQGACEIIRSGEFVQQYLGFLEVRRGKPFGEPVRDVGQQLAGCGALALLLPEATQAQHRTEFWHLRLLAASNGQRLLKTVFGLMGVRAGERQ